MPALKWQRIADSDNITIIYLAVTRRRDNEHSPYYAYRITPIWDGPETGPCRYYGISLCRGDVPVEEIGSVDYGRSVWTGRERRGEYKLADAKRTAQQHHDTAGHTLHQL